MKLKLVEVQIKGEKQYLIEASIFAQKTVTKNPLEATNYENKDDELARDLDMLAVKGDSSYARSGLQIEEAPMIVEFEIKIEEISRVVGREVRG